MMFKLLTKFIKSIHFSYYLLLSNCDPTLLSLDQQNVNLRPSLKIRLFMNFLHPFIIRDQLKELHMILRTYFNLLTHNIPTFHWVNPQHLMNPIHYIMSTRLVFTHSLYILYHTSQHKSIGVLYNKINRLTHHLKNLMISSSYNPHKCDFVKEDSSLTNLGIFQTSGVAI